jgi:hypothetical protein
MAENDKTVTIGELILKEGEKAYVYKVGFVPDTGDMELDISPVHQDFLVWLSTNGGETAWDSSKVDPEVDEHVMVLVDIGVLTKAEIIGHNGICNLRMTDLGRKAATVIRKNRKMS